MRSRVYRREAPSGELRHGPRGIRKGVSKTFHDTKIPQITSYSQTILSWLRDKRGESQRSGTMTNTSPSSKEDRYRKNEAQWTHGCPCLNHDPPVPVSRVDWDLISFHDWQGCLIVSFETGSVSPEGGLPFFYFILFYFLSFLFDLILFFPSNIWYYFLTRTGHSSYAPILHPVFILFTLIDYSVNLTPFFFIFYWYL